MPAHNAGEGAGGAQGSLSFSCSLTLSTAAFNGYLLTDGNGQYVALLCRDTGALTRLKVAAA